MTEQENILTIESLGTPPERGMQLEIVRDAIFDTLFLPENLRAGKGILFCIPLGQYAGRQLKGYEHTSMYCAGMLDAPKKFLVQSIHCHLFDPDGGLIPLTDRVWDGSFALEISGKRVVERPLREMADANILRIIRNETRDQKYYNVQELENPLKDNSEFYQAMHGKLERTDRFFIEQCECFTGEAFFARSINVPLTAIFALNGILGRAIV